MKFAAKLNAGWTGTLANKNLEAANLMLFLSPKMQSKARSEPAQKKICKTFLADVEQKVVSLKNRIEFASMSHAHGKRRVALQGIANAAHKMQHALSPLSTDGDLFEEMRPAFEGLLILSREPGKAATARPTAPPHSEEVPALDVLLTRIYADLQLLRSGCEFAAKHFVSNRNPLAGVERMVVSELAEVHRFHFGCLPPERGWFANDFIPYIACELGLVIGHTVVEKIVKDKK